MVEIDEYDGYPHQLAGEDAEPPKPVNRRVFDMALRADARTKHGPDPLAGGQLVDAAAGWRLAGSIAELFAEANASDPKRAKASDGTIGDARHVGEGSDSDHNPWLVVAGVGVVRAGDITNDPAMHLDQVAERIRVAAKAGGLPQVTGGGYVILNGRITADDWSGWKVYTGSDPHVAHMHVSVSRIAAQFDLRSSWGVFGSTPAPIPPTPPAPGPRPAYNWTGPDLTGKGATLRGVKGANGPRVGQLHDFLRRYAPAYAAGLPGAASSEYGWYGDDTAAVLRQFAARSNIANADGLNIGPKIALALWRDGFDR